MSNNMDSLLHQQQHGTTQAAELACSMQCQLGAHDMPHSDTHFSTCVAHQAHACHNVPTSKSVGIALW
jgi:hypothetical protein